jgi:hypothetical protein
VNIQIVKNVINVVKYLPTLSIKKRIIALGIVLRKVKNGYYK